MNKVNFRGKRVKEYKTKKKGNNILVSPWLRDRVKCVMESVGVTSLSIDKPLLSLEPFENFLVDGSGGWWLGLRVISSVQQRWKKKCSSFSKQIVSMQKSVLKICTVSWDICQNVPKFIILSKTPKNAHFLDDISGTSAYILDPFLRWDVELKSSVWNCYKNLGECHPLEINNGVSWDHELLKVILTLSKATFQSLSKMQGGGGSFWPPPRNE